MKVYVLPHATAGDQRSQQVGGWVGYNKTEYGDNLEFRNRTKEFFEWETEYDLDGLMEPYPGSHPDLAAEFPVLILEGDTTGPITAVDTETIGPNNISDASASNNSITNTQGFCDDRNSPTPIFSPINPTPDTISMSNLMMKISTLVVIIRIVMMVMVYLRK